MISLKVEGHYFGSEAGSLLIASYGNVVPAFPGRDWRPDLDLLVQNGLPYARLWHILSPETQEWPWLRTGNKWDLNQRNETYWSTIGEILEATAQAGVMLEPHIFDRGCGGAQSSYRGYPWHPKNNSQHLALPTNGVGTPEFYQKTQPLRRLQERYVEWWIEAVRPYSHVVLEIENEHRDSDPTWVRDWTRFIKALKPEQIISYSTLGDDWNAAARRRKLDVINIHSGREGRDPAVLRNACQLAWGFKKPVNVDEFGNGEKNQTRLRQCCWAIVTSGGNFHIEDANESAQPISICQNINAFLQESGWRFWEAAPSGMGMLSPGESVLQSVKGEAVQLRAGSLRWWDPRNGGFGPWLSHGGGKAAPPSKTDWIVQASH